MFLIFLLPNLENLGSNQKNKNAQFLSNREKAPKKTSKISTFSKQEKIKRFGFGSQ